VHHAIFASESNKENHSIMDKESPATAQFEESSKFCDKLERLQSIDQQLESEDTKKS